MDPQNSPPVEGCPKGRGGNSPPVEGCPKGRGGNSPPVEGCPKGRGGRNTKAYLSLPYNPKLRNKAKELRKAGNLAEVLLWNQLKNRQFMGFDFDRQKIIGNYIVDFFWNNGDTIPNCGIQVSTLAWCPHNSQII